MKAFSTQTAALFLLTLSACAKPEAEIQPTLHEVMAGTIDPVADVIWETSSRSYGQDGNAQEGSLTDKDWLAIELAARKLHDGATIIIRNPDLKATRPGVKILDEGTEPAAVTAAQVATYLDRDRPGLAKEANALSTIALSIETAAKAHDAPTVVKLSEDLDDVCEGCHQKFWYPEQKKPGSAS